MSLRDLSLLIWLPLASALVGALLPRRISPLLPLLGSIATLVLAIVLVADFATSKAGLQYVTDKVWISSLGIHYKLGIDGLNLMLVLLTAATSVAAGLAAYLKSPIQITESRRQFFFHLGLAETAVLGALCAQDLALFVAFFDLMLVPFYFLVGIWGGTGRTKATTKLVIYTLVGSLLMLVAAISTAVLAEPANGSLTFVLSDLAKTAVPEDSRNWIFLCFALAFLVKMPAFPLHGWMPDAYRTMPIPALVLFSGVLSKVAAYGFIRIVLPLFPEATEQFQLTIMILALVSIVYGSAMAFTTRETRLIVGYSSIAQLGFILLGIFSLEDRGAQGAVLQMVTHGLVVVPLFFLIAFLADRAGGSEHLRDMGGVAFRAPVLAALFLIVAFATLALPGSANFAAEFLILLGAFEAKLPVAVIASVGVVLASVYMLRAFIRATHNRTGPRVNSRELSVSEGLLVVPLVAVIVALSLYPQFALKRSERSVDIYVSAARDRIPPEQVEMLRTASHVDGPVRPLTPEVKRRLHRGRPERRMHRRLRQGSPEHPPRTDGTQRP